MIEFLNFMYQGSFYSTVVLFVIMCLLGFNFLLLIKMPLNSALSSAFSLSFPLTLIGYLSINFAPIPNLLQNNVKNLLIQQAREGVGSNAFVNSIVIPCQDKAGYVRGYNYGQALESYTRDLKNHLDKTEAFKVRPNDKLNIDKNLSLCEFAKAFNNVKFQQMSAKND